MKRIITLLCIISFNCLNAFCQVNLDSLWGIWNDNSQHDTIRLNAIHSIAEDGYSDTNPDSAFYFAQMQYDLASRSGHKKQMADALSTQGVSFYKQDIFDSAFHYQRSSLTIREEIIDKIGIANSLHDIGRVYMALGEYDSAMDLQIRSLAIFQDVGNKTGIGDCYNAIGQIYRVEGDYAKAIDYFTLSLTLREEISDQRGISSCLNNIAHIKRVLGNNAEALDYYGRSLTISENIGFKWGIANSLNGFGITFKDQGDYARSLEYHYRSLKIREEIMDREGASLSLNNIGVVYQEQGDYEKALEHFIRSLRIREKIEFRRGISTSLNKIGGTYFEQGYYVRAIDFSSRALAIAEELGVALETREAAEDLYKSYKATGKPDKALEMYELFISLRDSILNEENQKAVIRQEYKYTYDKKVLADSLKFEGETIIHETKLKQSKTQFYATIVVLILVLVIAFVFFKGREKQKKLNVELKSAQTQLIQSEKMASLGQLTAGIAHEINNPISFIQTSSFALDKDLNDITSIIEKYSEFLRKSKLDISEITDFKIKIDYDTLLESIKQEINDIKEGTKRTTEIVRGLHQFSHEDNIEMEPADIHDGIDITLNLVNSRLEEGVILIKNYDQSINEITCHIGQLNQVFLNMFTNALDAMSGKGKLEITTKKKAMGIAISIKDDGQGIPEDIISNIFEPFFTTKKVGEGTGLGLSISHGIIKKHGGTIDVKSEEGKGSEFIITLPV